MPAWQSRKDMRYEDMFFEKENKGKNKMARRSWKEGEGESCVIKLAKIEWIYYHSNQNKA